MDESLCWAALGAIGGTLGAFATAAAVIVAMKANRNANQQLEKALQMHEQSKNLELLDRRMELLQKLREDVLPDRVSFLILFNAEIKQKYMALEQLTNRLKEHKADLETCGFLISVAYEDTQKECPLEKIKDAAGLAQFSQGCVGWEEQEKKFKDLSEQNEVSSTYGAKGGEWKTYNYYAITCEIKKTEAEITEAKKDLIEAMERFIQNSIEPLTKE